MKENEKSDSLGDFEGDEAGASVTNSDFKSQDEKVDDESLKGEEGLTKESIDLLALDKATYTPREISIALASELNINANAAYQRLMRWIRGGKIKSTRRFMDHEYRVYKADVENILKGVSSDE